MLTICVGNMAKVVCHVHCGAYIHYVWTARTSGQDRTGSLAKGPLTTLEGLQKGLMELLHIQRKDNSRRRTERKMRIRASTVIVLYCMLRVTREAGRKKKNKCFCVSKDTFALTILRAQLIFDGLCEFNLYHSGIKHY